MNKQQIVHCTTQSCCKVVVNASNVSSAFFDLIGIANPYLVKMSMPTSKYLNPSLYSIYELKSAKSICKILIISLILILILKKNLMKKIIIFY